jgi:hypothetical protein
MKLLISKTTSTESLKKPNTANLKFGSSAKYAVEKYKLN